MLQSALKKVVGQETSQAGSLVAFDRLRFDFNFHRPLSDNEIFEIEGLINGWIGDATLLQTKVMALDAAKRVGAIAMFGEKYGEQVRFYSLTVFYLLRAVTCLLALANHACDGHHNRDPDCYRIFAQCSKHFEYFFSKEMTFFYVYCSFPWILSCLGTCCRSPWCIPGALWWHSCE